MDNRALYRKHSEWCRREAQQLRNMAEEAKDSVWAEKWNRDAARKEDDANWYQEHAEFWQ